MSKREDYLDFDLSTPKPKRTIWPSSSTSWGLAQMEMGAEEIRAMVVAKFIALQVQGCQTGRTASQARIVNECARYRMQIKTQQFAETYGRRFNSEAPLDENFDLEVNGSVAQQLNVSGAAKVSEEFRNAT